MFFTHAARAHAGRASSHSTPAACRPPNSADGSHLTSPLLPLPAVYQNPDGGVARPADVGLARKTGHGDRPESNGPAQRVEPRCRSRPSKSNPVFGFVVHGTGVVALASGSIQPCAVLDSAIGLSRRSRVGAGMTPDTYPEFYHLITIMYPSCTIVYPSCM